MCVTATSMTVITMLVVWPEGFLPHAFWSSAKIQKNIHKMGNRHGNEDGMMI